MSPQELMDVRDLLFCLKGKTLTGRMYDRIVESIRVVQRDIDLQTINYVTGKRKLGFEHETGIPQHDGIEGQS